MTPSTFLTFVILTSGNYVVILRTYKYFRVNFTAKVCWLTTVLHLYVHRGCIVEQFIGFNSLLDLDGMLEVMAARDLAPLKDGNVGLEAAHPVLQGQVPAPQPTLS